MCKSLVAGLLEYPNMSEVLDDQEINKELYLPGTFGCHEALDRTSLIAGLMGNLTQHPAIQLNELWIVQAENIEELLYKLYADIGEEHLK